MLSLIGVVVTIFYWCMNGASPVRFVLSLFERCAFQMNPVLLFAMIRSVVKSFKVPGVEIVASRMSNEAALRRMIDSTQKKLGHT